MVNPGDLLAQSWPAWPQMILRDLLRAVETGMDPILAGSRYEENCRFVE
jgi:hypothetical protein